MVKSDPLKNNKICNHTLSMLHCLCYWNEKNCITTLLKVKTFLNINFRLVSYLIISNNFNVSYEVESFFYSVKFVKLALKFLW